MSSSLRTVVTARLRAGVGKDSGTDHACDHDMSNVVFARAAGDRASRDVRTRIGLVLLFVAVLIIAIWAMTRSARTPRLEQLPSDVRSALYARTLADLELCAGSTAAALGDHCEHQAAFIEMFPECDDSCRTLASRWSSHATR